MANRALAGLGAGLASLGQSGIQYSLQQMRDQFLADREDARLEKQNVNENARLDKTQAFQSGENELSRKATAEGQDKTIKAGATEGQSNRDLSAKQHSETIALQKKQLDAEYAFKTQQATTEAQQRRIDQEYKVSLAKIEGRNATIKLGSDLVSDAGKTNAMGEPIIDKGTAGILRGQGMGLISGAMGEQPQDTPSPLMPTQSTAPRQAPAAAIEALRANPSRKQEFFQQYGYVPQGF